MITNLFHLTGGLEAVRYAAQNKFVKFVVRKFVPLPLETPHKVGGWTEIPPMRNKFVKFVLLSVAILPVRGIYESTKYEIYEFIVLRRTCYDITTYDIKRGG